MKITVYAKKRSTKDGKTFYTYISKLPKKDGSTVTASVMFPEDNKPKPDACPCNIEFKHENANLDRKTDVAEDGNVYERNTLWLKKFEFSAEKFVDTSLNEFED